MLEINLLPDELRNKKKGIFFKMPDLSTSAIPILALVIISIILIHILLIVTIRIKVNAYKNLSEEWKRVGTEKALIELTKRENTKIKKKLEEVENLINKRVLWSKKLNRLSDLVVPGIWLTRLSIDQKTTIIETEKVGDVKKRIFGMKDSSKKKVEKYLTIEGEASSAYGDTIALIGKFIEQLKNDTEFIEDFSNIELYSTKLHSIGQIDTMKFIINCYFKRND